MTIIKIDGNISKIGTGDHAISYNRQATLGTPSEGGGEDLIHSDINSKVSNTVSCSIVLAAISQYITSLWSVPVAEPT